MGDSEAMVAQGYTSAPYGDYNTSAAATTVESTGQENASLVNGTGPEGGSSAPVENGKVADKVAVTAPGAEHGDNAGNHLFFQSCV